MIVPLSCASNVGVNLPGVRCKMIKCCTKASSVRIIVVTGLGCESAFGAEYALEERVDMP